jgi:hypothetical protein
LELGEVVTGKTGVACCSGGNLDIDGLAQSVAQIPSIQQVLDRRRHL